MGACANLPDSQGLVPFKVISPEHSKTGQLRQAQSNLMDDLTMENWGEKEMTHARYQPRRSWKGVIPAIHLPSRKCLNEWALSVGANPSSLWGRGCPSILWSPCIVSRFGRGLLGDFWQSISAQFGTLSLGPVFTQAGVGISICGPSSYLSSFPDMSVANTLPYPYHHPTPVSKFHW